MNQKEEEEGIVEGLRLDITPYRMRSIPTCADCADVPAD